MRSFSLVIVFVILLVTCSVRCWADNSSFDVNSDAQIDLRYDYSMDIIVKNSNYLSYPGSTVTPLTQLLITYRINPKFKKIPNAGQHISYEELWYNAAQVVGSRRLSNLNIPSSFQGVIRVVPSTTDLSNDKPVANAIIRLFLDLNVNHCLFNVAFVPIDIFSAVVYDMPENHFQLNPPPSKTLSLTFNSNPIGSSKTVYYVPY